MSEEEMNDVNGGSVSYDYTRVFGLIVGAEIQFSNEALNTLIGMIAAGTSFAGALKLLGVKAAVATPLAVAGLILYGTLQLYASLGWGFAYGFVGAVVYHRPIF